MVGHAGNIVHGDGAVPWHRLVVAGHVEGTSTTLKQENAATGVGELLGCDNTSGSTSSYNVVVGGVAGGRGIVAGVHASGGRLAQRQKRGAQSNELHDAG